MDLEESDNCRNDTYDNAEFVKETVTSLLEFTNIKCKSHDKQFTDFEYCYLRSVNRSYKYMSVKARLFQIPVTNVTIRYTFLRRDDGYTPFLSNFTVDACEFLRSPKDPIAKFFYGLIVQHSNMNHTCPYNHDVFIDKLDTSFLSGKFKGLPIPNDAFILKSTWFAYNIPRADVNVYVKIN
ncbi:uncharacterized protein LOC119676509 [Teleopsis dalmanni]|uniref:uncharacterized protein LOC119676509 n=1 Tax=Teleopsis dalmanni TaxID=139649 RepID=UPI0018CFAAC3|nr:uncharacterized protein LOC119676509 [Teleopsis dalmanni]